LAAAAERILIDPSQILSTARLIAFKGVNSYALEQGPSGPALRSTPNGSASGLYEEVNVEGRDLRWIQWSWRVERLHLSADVRDLSREDFGAALMFVFGEPSFFNRDVPTLAYVWTSTPLANGARIASRRFQSLHYFQLRGQSDVGIWQAEVRDVAADYRAVFGHEPPMLKYIAVFNDNDQTGEDTSALFGSVHQPAHAYDQGHTRDGVR
jgi:hypothetical protein